MTEKEFRQKERNAAERKNAAKRKKKKRRTAIVILVVLLALLIAAGVSVAAFTLFKVETISVTGNTVYPSEQILSIADINVGDSLLLLNEKKLSEKLSHSLPYIDSIDIKRELPNTLHIEVAETYEDVCYYNGNKFYSADKNDKILNEYFAVPENLSVIITEEKAEFTVGGTFTGEETAAMVNKAILSFAEKENISITVINSTDKYDNYFIINDRFLVLLGSSTNLDRKLEFVPKTVEKLEGDSRNVIDLSNWSHDNNEAISYEKDINTYYVFK